MSKLYITYNEKTNRREYYSYEVTDRSETPVFLALKDLEREAYLSKVVRATVTSVREVNGNLLEVITSNDDIIVIDNIKVFKEKCDDHDALINALASLVSAWIEKENISKYKKEHPDYNTKKVNRNRPKFGKLIVGGLSLTLATIMLINGLASELNKKGSKEAPTTNVTKINDLPEKTLAHIESIIEIASEPIKEKIAKIDIKKMIEEATKTKVEFAFDDWTETGKLEKTVEDCSPYLNYWINRYGLPSDLTYAVYSLESGILECVEQKNGACGPSQIQLGAQHGEHYKVMVYENGVPTGEYDEFWVADARKLDDPALEGKPIKIIQNLEDNFQIGCAYYQRCINRYKNIFLATDTYNKGLYSYDKVYEKCGDKIEKPLEYYKENMEDFSWTSIIPEHSKEVFGSETYGDPKYILDVLKYLDTDTRGDATIEYCYKGEVISVDIHNTNVYNNDYQRGK